MKIHTLDLNFIDTPKTVAAFIVEVGDEVVLVETGPYSVYPNLVNEVKKIGFKMRQITKVFLSHIHLDHAGGAWAIDEKNNVPVYLHPKGIRHLADPEKLLQSATMIYKEDMDRLWSTIKPISESQLISVDDSVVISLGGDWEMRGHYTPGHASHHIGWEINKTGKMGGGFVFVGDVAGVRIDNGPVEVPLPPPDIDYIAWRESLSRLSKINPKAIYLTHFGEVVEVKDHLKKVDESLERNRKWFIQYYESGEQEKITEAYIEYTNNHLKSLGLDESAIKLYTTANPAFMTVLGMKRYLKKFEGLE